MKSKEEIVREIGLKTKTAMCLDDMIRTVVVPAMDEFAMQESQLFSEWASMAGYKFCIGWYDDNAMGDKEISFEELYELYKSETKCA